MKFVTRRLSGWILGFLGMLLWVQPTFAQNNNDSRINTLLSRAKEQIGKSQYTEALGAVTQAAVLVNLPDPSNIRAHAELPKIKPDVLGQILYYRGLAFEGSGAFAEARNDYLAFLTVLPESPLAQDVRQHIQNIDRQAIRYLANLARQSEAKLGRFYDREDSRYTIGVMPFFNQTQNNDLSRVGYGISGFLTSVLGNLGSMTDKPFATVERARLNTILTEVNIGRFYNTGDKRIPAPSVGKILGAEFLLSGTVRQESDGRLMIRPILTHVAKDTSYVLPEKSAAGTNVGLKALQEQLTYDIADAVQRLTGFRYLVSRAAFMESINNLLVDDLQHFLVYAQGFDVIVAGNMNPTTQVLEDANITMSGRDRLALDEARSTVLQSYTNVTDLLNQTSGMGGLTIGSGGGANAAGTVNTRKNAKSLTFGYAATQLGLLTLGESGITNGDAGISANPNETGDTSGKTPGALNPANQPFIKIQIVVPLPKSN